MGKAVINTCYGGFGISEEAYNWLKEHNIDKELIHKSYNDISESYQYHYYGSRHYPLFIKCVEELGEKASGWLAELRVVEFEGDLYRIDEYDGYESVETPNDIRWTNVNEY